MVPPAVPLPPATEAGQIPSTTPVSDALSADLRKRGFRFVGSTIVYAFMQSVASSTTTCPAASDTAADPRAIRS